MLYVETGVWHNPRIIKQKQYIPKYALTLANLIRNDYKLPDLLFLRIDSSVKYVWFACANDYPLIIACKGTTKI